MFVTSPPLHLKRSRHSRSVVHALLLVSVALGVRHKLAIGKERPDSLQLSD